MSTASSVVFVSGANLHPTATASPLANTHVIVFKDPLRADEIDIVQIVSCRFDGVSEVLLMVAKFSKPVCCTPVVWNCAGTYPSEASVTAKREGGWWPDKGIRLDRLRRCIRNDGKEHCKKRAAGAKQIAFNVIVQTIRRRYFVGFKFNNRIELVNPIAFI